MFDNFGLGEFAFLAILALLFFGPERLPYMGARLGRWISRMTQYSKAFMSEWREEALVIHDAVAEVKGIRDEIVAAQAEIVSTMQTARGDVTEGIDSAREAVSGATRDVTDRMRFQQEAAAQDLDRLARERDGKAEAGEGEGAAIDKTLQILAGLQERQQAEPTERPAVGDEKWNDVHRMIQEGVAPQPSEQEAAQQTAEAVRTPAQQTAAQQTAAQQTAAAAADGAPEEQVAPQEEAALRTAALQTAGAAEPVPETKQESPFDRTQKILDGLMARRSGEDTGADAGQTAAQQTAAQTAGAEQAPAQRTAAQQTAEAPQTAAKVETAFERTQRVLDQLARRRQGQDAPKDEGEPPVVDRTEFEQLNADVLRLRDEIGALQQEIAALSALARRASVPTDAASGTVLDEDLSIEEVS